MSKYIFVTGGVVSSLGKGIAAASIGKILEWNGYRIGLIKCDPYINVDPGTMNPYQHGEVYVTDDGAETDLDLGHYHRYTDSPLSRISNVTTGKVYQTVINKERRGDFLGGTVQVIPHITDEIKRQIKKNEEVYKPDVLIIELGGTVGDIEGMPFLESIRQLKNEKGFGNAINVHLTLLPYIKAAGEIKTKPTQHSVNKLREIGIQPEVLMVRTEKHIGAGPREKIALFCNVEEECVIEARDVPDIYEIPLMYYRDGLDGILLKKLKLKAGKKSSRIKKWEKIIDKRKKSSKKVKIGVVGKYITLQDAYKSIDEALQHGAIHNDIDLELVKIESDDLEGASRARIEETFRGISGVLIPGGFGARGIEGKLAAAGYAREESIPYLGICLGMQVAVIEFARNVCGLKGANSTEFNKRTKYPVISLLSEQENVKDMGGTMRLGRYRCRVRKSSIAGKIYSEGHVYERHRHRYEFNSAFKKQFKEKGMVFSGINPGRDLVEMIELKEHPWFLAVQFHPEFRSRPEAPHPLFSGFIEAAAKNAR